MTSQVGYTGGTSKQPTYRNMGDHTETVEVTYDPSVISYEKLLEFFWKSHNPFTKSRPQYMSAIFCHGQNQMNLAKSSMADVQKQYAQPITTVIKTAEDFFTAEEYHQKYLLRQHPKLLRSLNLSPANILTSFAATKLNAFVNNDASRTHVDQVCHELALSEDQTTYIRRQMDRR